MQFQTVLCRSSSPLESFSQGRFKYRENRGRIPPPPWYIRFHRICWEMPKNVGTYFIVLIYIQTPNLGPHIYLAVFGRFWNLCSLSFSIQIGRPWWMEPNARAMAKKLRRFVSDLWFIQNTQDVHNKYSPSIQVVLFLFEKRGAEWKCISRFHFWYIWLIVRDMNWLSSFSHFEFDAI